MKAHSGVWLVTQIWKRSTNSLREPPQINNRRTTTRTTCPPVLNLLLPSTPLCNISSPTSCCHLPTPDSSHRQKESTLAISSTELQQSPPQVCAHSDCVAIFLERKVVRSPSKRQSLQTLANTGTGKQRNGPSISHIGYRFP